MSIARVIYWRLELQRGLHPPSYVHVVPTATNYTIKLRVRGTPRYNTVHYVLVYRSLPMDYFG